ncbi:PREDICTED: protein cornichon homolog 4 isoform X2 [Galeopterus variegatus]|uniref:Protein cornichon homolog 4 isoform X2 n=1 Tax=Galeopterus variegatus TaxID=482537 RepID=A0ABM0RG31_GALVR|nr:PREDICTED: protein cornichon homolog 4 isoform X2 [Galeopterus variegatus]
MWLTYVISSNFLQQLLKWVIPELIGHTIVTMLMLVSLHWFIFLLNLPVATWNIYRFIMVPSGNMGVFDPTEIHNRGQLKSHMKEAMIKLGFHLLCFFMYLYSGSRCPCQSVEPQLRELWKQDPRCSSVLQSLAGLAQLPFHTSHTDDSGVRNKSTSASLDLVFL